MGRKAAMLLIVTDDDRLLMHLRDDKPGILHPGCWAGFGGALEAGETPLQALHREVEEETGLRIRDPQFLVEVVDVEGALDRVSLYYVRGGIAPDEIDLREGAGIGVHAFDDLDGLPVTPFVRRAVTEHLLPAIAASDGAQPSSRATRRVLRGHSPEGSEDMPEPYGGTVRLATFDTRGEAEVARGALAAEGIDALLLADDAGGAGGLSLSLDHQRVELRVAAHDLIAARGVIDAARP